MDLSSDPASQCCITKLFLCGMIESAGAIVRTQLLFACEPRQKFTRPVLGKCSFVADAMSDDMPNAHAVRCRCARSLRLLGTVGEPINPEAWR